MPEWVASTWTIVGSVLVVVLALLTAGHAVAYKRDSRAALLWVGLIWLIPFVGSVLYFLLGINRIRRRARLLRGGLERVYTQPGTQPLAPGDVRDRLPRSARHLAALNRLVHGLVARPLFPGNLVTPLVGGDEAYPAMWRAIDSAERSICLGTYIFDYDPIGESFVERLAAAMRRGVAVRVLVDDAGAHYSFPRITRLLQRHAVPVARFHPRFLFIPTAALNLRNHRKICVVDGRVGFTGGMNIRAGNMQGGHEGHAIRDVHFKLEGPIVAALSEVFAEDWNFTTDEVLEGDDWFPDLEPRGEALARGLADGPDEDFETLRWTILGALANARRSVRILTPYFLPTPSLISALNVAAMRGVDVHILIPGQGNLRFVQWATRAMLWRVLQHGCRVWMTPPPFDHAKLMVVDDHWTLLGSANWDPRSLRLNFEFNVECYDGELARRVAAIIDERRAEAREVTLEEMDSRSLPIRLRDGTARLFEPLL